MAVRLEIKNADGTPYWTEHFNNRQEGDRWLATEQTRPYWKKDFTFQFIDLPAPTPILRDPVAEAARAAARAKLSAVDPQSLTTLPALREAVADILIALGLK